MSSFVEIKELSKNYGKIHALDEVSFHVDEGKVFALLGPNGAGKSTLVKCLLGLVHPDRGEMSVKGVSCFETRSRQGISYLPEKFSYYPFYKVKSVLEFFSSLKNLPKVLGQEQILSISDKLNITETLNQKVETLSKGQLQRLGIAVTLLGDPQLLILDEPFSGLDPIGIRELKELLIQLKNEGKTIFFNSHLLAEMEKICDSCALLNKGRLIAHGDLDEMLQGKELETYFYEKVKGESF